MEWINNWKVIFKKCRTSLLKVCSLFRNLILMDCIILQQFRPEQGNKTTKKLQKFINEDYTCTCRKNSLQTDKNSLDTEKNSLNRMNGHGILTIQP